MKRKKWLIFPVILLFYSALLMAQDGTEKIRKDEEFKKDEVTRSDETSAKYIQKFKEKNKGRKSSENEIVVKGEANKMIFPVITDRKSVPGDPQNIMDVVKTQAILDHRGQSDLITKDDDYFMRGYSSSRFATAYDGMVVRKTGGRQASDIVDYGFIPPWLVQKTEIIPGPHSALYPAKSIGGVLNFVTKKPYLHDSLAPEVGLSASYKSYNTQNYNATASGGIKNLTYDAGYQYYSTDGYLRHTATDVQTLFGRLGWAFDEGGFMTFSVTDSRADRQLAIENYSGVDANDGCPIATATYDRDYPTVNVDQTGNTRNTFYSWQHPTWDRTSRTYHGDLSIPTAIGTFSGGGYYSEEIKTKEYRQYKAGVVEDVSSETKYWSQGGRLQDEINYFNRFKTTLAFDFEQLFDGEDRDERVRLLAGAVQQEWKIIEPLTLTLGLRYEHVMVNVSNSSSYPIAGEDEWITRNWDGILPKSVLTYDMDDLADAMRDTTVILAVSRIWHAPDYHGTYNPQGAPAGAWIDPEDGIGSDLILSRRLFADFYMKAGYSFAYIRNYLASNSQFAEYTPSGSNPVDASSRYKDYVINLEGMQRHGIELDLNGSVIPSVNIYLSYAYQKYINQGNEPAGDQEAGDRARHRLNAGIRYAFLKDFIFMADYSFQSEQVAVVIEETGTDVNGNPIYSYDRNPMSAYQLVDLALSYRLINGRFGMRNASFKVFVNNVFNEIYESAAGYPMTDRTFGCVLNVKI